MQMKSDRGEEMMIQTEATKKCLIFFFLSWGKMVVEERSQNLSKVWHILPSPNSHMVWWPCIIITVCTRPTFEVPCNMTDLSAMRI